MADHGLLENTSVHDFVGGIIVHETARLTALLVAAYLGPPRNKSKFPNNPGW